MPTLSYIVVVIALKYIHIERKAIMALGLFTIGLACIEIGPWKYSGLPHNLGIVIVASITFGIGYASCIIPALPDMIDSSQTLLSQYEHQQVSDFISGILNFGFFAGEMIGPPLAGVLRDKIGFENSEGAISLVLFLYIGIYVYFTKSYKCKVYEESVSPIMKNKIDVPYDTVALEDISVNP